MCAGTYHFSIKQQAACGKRSLVRPIIRKHVLFSSTICECSWCSSLLHRTTTLCNTAFSIACFCLAAETQLQFGVHTWASHIASHISRHTASPAASCVHFGLPCQHQLLKAAAHLSARMLSSTANISSAQICSTLICSSISCSHQNTISTTKTGPHLLVKISMQLECLLAITVPAKVQATLYSCELLHRHSPCQGLQAQNAIFIKC